MTRDPRENHPDFTPTDPPPARRGPLGVPLPPRAPPVIRGRDSSPPSRGWANVGAEAAKARVSISLALLGAIALGAYKMGSGAAADAIAVAAEVKTVASQCEAERRECEALRTECANALRSITVIEGRMQVIQSEQVQINSKIGGRQ